MEERKFRIRLRDIEVIRDISISNSIYSRIFENLFDLLLSILTIYKKDLVNLTSPNVINKLDSRAKIRNIEISNRVYSVVSENFIDFSLFRIIDNVIFWCLHDERHCSFFEFSFI